MRLTNPKLWKSCFSTWTHWPMTLTFDLISLIFFTRVWFMVQPCECWQMDGKMNRPFRMPTTILKKASVYLWLVYPLSFKKKSKLSLVSFRNHWDVSVRSVWSTMFWWWSDIDAGRIIWTDGDREMCWIWPGVPRMQGWRPTLSTQVKKECTEKTRLS